MISASPTINNHAALCRLETVSNKSWRSAPVHPTEKRACIDEMLKSNVDLHSGGGLAPLSPPLASLAASISPFKLTGWPLRAREHAPAVIVLIDCARSDSAGSHLHNASQHLSSLARSQASSVRTAAHFHASHTHIKGEYQCHLELQPIYSCLCLLCVCTNHSAMHATCNYYHFCRFLIYKLCGYSKPGFQ